MDAFKAEDYQKAISEFSTAISKSPNSNFLYYHRGNAKIEAGDFHGAKSDLSKSISLSPTFEAYLKRAVTEVELGYMDQALSDLKTAYGLRPTEPKINYYLGLAYNKLENYVDAIIYWDNFISSKPKNSEAYTGRGIALYHLGELDAAIADFKRSIYFDATYVEAHEWLALVYMAKEQPELAIQHYTMCVELSLDNSDFLLKRAEIYELTGNKQKACEDLERAGGASPDVAFSKCDS